MFRPRTPRSLAAGGGALAVGAVAAAVLVLSGLRTGAEGQDPADGLPHTPVHISSSKCGDGWTRPRGGLQVFDVRNTSDSTVEVELTDATTGKVHGEIESLAPGATRPLQVTLGNGSYAFTCLPDDSDAATGATVTISGSHAASGPAVLPVTVHDLIPPAITYQQWIGDRMGDLAVGVGALKAAIDSGRLAAARSAWLPAHLVYERMGAAYGTFGDVDKAINGTTAGLADGIDDSHFTGFHRIEYGLWHGQSATQLRGATTKLASDVDQLRASWAQTRMNPNDLGRRAHEILENTLQFELTGRTDYGSGSNLATARANLDGTRTVLGFLRPLLTSRDLGLTQLDAQLDQLQRTLDSFTTPSGWTPLDKLTLHQRERIDADLSESLEQLARVAAVCDVRRTS
ncbi:MAG: EfeM/EfeO family lipoprotein [Streptomycetaceae bacterium]|nr:EfeM/EfeO family lipoprotein [Streptomycetaceae bacterium]